MTDDLHFYAQFLQHIDQGHAHPAPHPAPHTAPHKQTNPTAPDAWAVYANTGLRAAMDALAANFPSVVHALGGPAFEPLARTFAQTHPPYEGRLFLYGQGFPEFLASREVASLHVEVSELACIDGMVLQAHAAADHLPLNAAHLSAMPAEALPELQLQVAPSTHWRVLSKGAVLDRWHQARGSEADLSLSPESSIGLLVTRPEDSVGVHEVPLGSLRLLDALAAGQALAEAATQARELNASPEAFNLQAALGALLAHGALKAAPEHYVNR